MESSRPRRQNVSRGVQHQSMTYRLRTARTSKYLQQCGSLFGEKETRVILTPGHRSDFFPEDHEPEDTLGGLVSDDTVPISGSAGSHGSVFNQEERRLTHTTT